MEKQNETISFGVARIKDLAFEIDETANVDEKLTSQVTFNNAMSFSLEQGQIHFVIDVRFFTDKVENSTFLRGKAQTTFFVENMQKFVKEDTNEIDLPHDALVAMFSISFSHTRALVAKASMGSRYNNLYLPLINPKELLESMLQAKQ